MTYDMFTLVFIVYRYNYLFVLSLINVLAYKCVIFAVSKEKQSKWSLSKAKSGVMKLFGLNEKGCDQGKYTAIEIIRII